MGYPKISVPVLWDANGQFLNGELQAVGADALVIGEVQKPTGPSVPPYQNQPTVTTLFVKDKIFGALYLNMTSLQWQAAIRAATGSPSPIEQTKTYHPVVSGNTITDPALTGATILFASIGGIAISPAGLLSGDVLTFAQDLNGSEVIVTFYTN